METSKSPAAQVRAYRKHHHLSHAKLSRLLDCDPSMVAKLEAGKRVPGRDSGLRERIQEVCGIPADSWDAPEEQPTASEG